MRYMIAYRVTNDRGGTVAEGKIVVGNATDEGHAMNKLRTHLSNKHWDFNRAEMSLVKKVVDDPLDNMDDMFGSLFSDIFGKK